MSKRQDVREKQKKGKCHKTAKRLAAKAVMLAAKAKKPSKPAALKKTVKKAVKK